MGNWFSSNSETSVEQKVGTINNGNIIINDSLPVHNNEALILIYLILCIIITKFALKLYRLHNHRIERRILRKSTINLQTA